jgi:hypothetical protein
VRRTLFPAFMLAGLALLGREIRCEVEGRENPSGVSFWNLEAAENGGRRVRQYANR